MSGDTSRMRSDWNRRAREDANYYVAFGRRGQSEEEFQATAGGVVRDLERELRHLGNRNEWATLRALEIGCGPGRLMLPMSQRLGEVHGVDVSDEMIRLAGERLRRIPNAWPRVNSGADLRAYADDSLDFVYSYAVFQHIPSREVVFHYLREARRVLRPGGLLRCQLNGLADSPTACDTWSGVNISPDQISSFALAEDMQLLALEGVRTQYMWVTMRQQPAGWHAELARRPAGGHCLIRRVTNASGSEPLAACRGRFAAISLFVESLPAECDLLHLEAIIGGGRGVPFYMGPPENDGLSQIGVRLPDGIQTGLQPVLLKWLDEPLCPPVTLRVVPPGPLVPRLVSVGDAVDLLSGLLIQSGIVKLVLEDVERISDLQVWVDGREAPRVETFCVDPAQLLYEVNVHLPIMEPGEHFMQLRLGPRRFSPILIQTVQFRPSSSDTGL